MEEVIKKVLNEYFADFKEYHLYILVGFTVAIGLIQIIQSMWVTRKIERFKSSLKKSEAKFSTYNNLQVKSLSKLYQILVDFQKNTNIVNKSSRVSPEKYAIVSKHWIQSYKLCMREFANEKYILPKEIKASFKSSIDAFQEINTFIRHEKDYMDMFYTGEYGDIEVGGHHEDLENIANELKKFDRNGTMEKSIENINKLRKDIEKRFEEME